MSYDLFFKPRTGNFESSRFYAYFSERPRYKVEGAQAWYQNEDTGAYFVFELRDKSEYDEEEHFPVALNVNFFRPSPFGLEAELEAKAFVKALDLTVLDTQIKGIENGEYSSELFLKGWNHGNEMAYSIMLSDPARKEHPISLPTDEIISAWIWNRNRSELQRELGESKFVPRVMFTLIDGQATATAIWPDGIPIAVPPVNHFFVPRKQLAPRRLFRRAEDITFVSRDQVLPIFRKFATTRDNGTLVLDYANTPKGISAFVESLPSNEREVTFVAADKVLNRELVEKYMV